jgi:uncharacterized protein (DUF58 family)
MAAPVSRKPRSQEDGCTRIALAELVALHRQIPRRLLAPSRVSPSRRSGAHVAKSRGRGMDYRESRAYQPGDDVRRLDWRLTARSGRLHTKLFQEERERTLMLLVDTHASMHFGTRRRFKSVQAARAAALAAWLGSSTNMRVGLAGFGLQRGVVRPRAGSRGALAVIHALHDWQGAESSHEENEPLSVALQRLDRIMRSGSRVLIISDGFSVDPGTRTALVGLRHHAAVGLLTVVDAFEQSAPPAGSYPFAWRDKVQNVDLTNAAARQAFQASLGTGAQHLHELARSLALRSARIETRDEPLPAVARALGIAWREQRS